jgi:hypothetical protein
MVHIAIHSTWLGQICWTAGIFQVELLRADPQRGATTTVAAVAAAAGDHHRHRLQPELEKAVVRFCLSFHSPMPCASLAQLLLLLLLLLLPETIIATAFNNSVHHQ